MGIFLDLLQESELTRHAKRADSLELRVNELEKELDSTRRLLRDVIQRLEDKLGTDLNRDGRIG